MREEERAVMAGEIHDELGQALTGLKFDLAWLKGRMEDRPEVADEFYEVWRGTGCAGLPDSVILP